MNIIFIYLKLPRYLNVSPLFAPIRLRYYVFQHERHRFLTVNNYFLIYCHLLISTPIDITGLVRPR